MENQAKGVSSSGITFCAPHGWEMGRCGRSDPKGFLYIAVPKFSCGRMSDDSPGVSETTPARLVKVVHFGASQKLVPSGFLECELTGGA